VRALLHVGTTGRPKGVVYTHRSTYLHALGVSSGAGMSIGPGDSVLPQVPMFHANAWGMAHAAVGVGAKLVFYAGAFEPDPFAELLSAERVTVTAVSRRCGSVSPTRWRRVANGSLAAPHRLGWQPTATEPHRALRLRLRIRIIQAGG